MRQASNSTAIAILAAQWPLLCANTFATHLRALVCALLKNICVILPLAMGTSLSHGETLPKAKNLQIEAQQAAAQGEALVILFSRRDCRWCEQVRRDFLLPLSRHKTEGKRFFVRQVDQDEDFPLKDFHGKNSQHSAFAAHTGIRMVPVVAFYGPHGEALAPPIIGMRTAEFYGGYLDQSLQLAREKLANTP